MKEIEKIKKAMEALQKQITELEKGEVKYEVDKWYTSPKTGEAIFCVTRISGRVVYAYGINWKGEWKDGIDFSNITDDRVKATDKEVEEALIKEAKKRGFKEGVTVTNIFGCKGVIGVDFYGFTEWSGGVLSYLGCYIFKNGKWATIIEEPKVVINGSEMKQEGDIISFGCAKFHKDWFDVLYNDIRSKNKTHVLGMKMYEGTNRKISSIKLDSGVELSIEDLKKIVDNIK